jgi:hypothetical protein
MYANKVLQITKTSTTNEDNGAYKLQRRKTYVARGRKNDNTTCTGSNTNIKTSSYAFNAMCKQIKYHKTICTLFACY